MNVFKKIGGGVRFLWKRCRAFTITGTSLIALLLAVNLIILQVPLITNNDTAKRPATIPTVR